MPCFPVSLWNSFLSEATLRRNALTNLSSDCFSPQDKDIYPESTSSVSEEFFHFIHIAFLPIEWLWWIWNNTNECRRWGLDEHSVWVFWAKTYLSSSSCCSIWRINDEVLASIRFMSTQAKDIIQTNGEHKSPIPNIFNFDPHIRYLMKFLTHSSHDLCSKNTFS